MQHSRDAAQPSERPEFGESLVLALVPEDAPGPLSLVEVVLDPGVSTSVHRLSHSVAIYLAEGSVAVRREGGTVELDGPGAFFLPGGEARTVRNVGVDPARLLLAFATGASPGPVLTSPADASELGNARTKDSAPASRPAHPWAVAVESAPWESVEPSKGLRVRCRYLNRHDAGLPEFVVGTAVIDPETHYTYHRHAPAEAYHVLSGRAIMHVADQSFAVRPGDTVVVPSGTGHGIDTGEEALELYWFYVTDVHREWDWEPLEPIYPRPPMRPLDGDAA